MNMQWEATGQGEPLVLVPGGLTGWLSWIPIAERLSTTRRVVRVQLLSVQLGLEGQPLPAGYTPGNEKAALAETLDSIGLTAPVDFAGWSYGAEVTLDFALDHPEWVRTLTLIEPPAFWTLPSLDEDMQRQSNEDRSLSRTDVTEDGLAHFLRRAALVPPDTNPRAAAQWPTWVRHRQSLRAVPFIAEYGADRTRISRLHAPTLLVKGTGSDLLSHRIIDHLATELPNAQVAEWPGGHAPHLVSMDSFLEAMAKLQEEGASTVK